MNWIKIDRNNLPKKEVLAANFQPGTYGYKEKIIGFVDESEEGFIGCESESELLENCTHYIDMNEHDIIEKSEEMKS